MGFFDKLFGNRPRDAGLGDRFSAQAGYEEGQAMAKAFMAGRKDLLEVGVMFDVARLGGGFYGHTAYKTIFDNLDPRKLKGCMVHDGDALAISSDLYCICFQTTEPEQADYIRRTMGAVEAPGLLPGPGRFLTGRVAAPNFLVDSGFIDPEGAFNVKKNGMVGEGWAAGTPWTIFRKL